MLEEMRIRGLGVIDDAVLPLGPGLTVVTGETGAGKTMGVQGLSLLFGGRSDAGRVRPGADRALVEGRLVLPAGHPALARATDAGAELDDDALLITRAVAADGRSRAHLGGRSVPVGVLGELGELVMALHGQSDQQRLLKPAQQRGALDRYAGEPVVALRERFAATWVQWRDVRATLAQLRDEAAERSREAELLRLGLAEVEAAEPLAGEDRVLVAEVERLANADDLRAAAATASQALTGDESEPEAGDALALVTAARRALQSAAAHDPQLAALGARLVELGHLVTDVALELSSYLASVDADPVRLSVAQERLAVLTALVRRHGTDDLDGVLAWADRASRRLLELDGAEDRIGALEQQDADLEAALGGRGGELSAARTAAAERFGAAVSAELVELAMPHARVSARVSQDDVPGGLPVGDRRLAASADGVDDVELLLEPHPGAPARALQKGASGGELSRVMLAVEVVFAGSDPVPLMVFDEVDAGVGGRAAVEVGRRLARLARDHQVVVVTHLPQVAAFADRHLQVVKAIDGSVTRSGVVALDDAERVAELSRMLAGVDTGLARGHAEELLAAAAQDRAAP
ncbi:MAG: DNA repair protein RecN [Frankiaceae bacterium]|nr:DNA repair protein RecN [Frankiaceae bacterium]